MTQGPLGLPRPLATGGVVLLTAVDDSDSMDRHNLTNLESILRQKSNLPIKHVEVDESVNTFAFVTELDMVELDNLERLSDIVENELKQYEAVGHSVGFR